MECEYEAGVFLQLLVASHERGAGTTRKQRDARMDTEGFKDLFRLREEARRHEHKTERYLRRAQLAAQVFRPLSQSDLIKVLIPMRGD